MIAGRANTGKHLSRASAVAALECFYAANGLSVGHFGCEHRQQCTAIASPRPLKHGAEAHVGSLYGKALRVVVISMDVGGGQETHNIAERTSIIENVGEKANPHMMGTRRFLKEILQPEIGDSSPLSYFAMTNAAKCSATDGSMDAVPGALYDRCKPFSINEMACLDPNVVWMQGSRVWGLLNSHCDYDSNPASDFGPDVDVLIREFVGFIQFGTAGKAVCIATPHPADRGGRWHQFQRAFMPLVAREVRRLASMESIRGPSHPH